MTVLLPVKDGGDLLRDAVESVIACAREMPPEWPVELLIVDDGSQDGAVERAVAAISAGGDADAAAVTAAICGGASSRRVPHGAGARPEDIEGTKATNAHAHGAETLDQAWTEAGKRGVEAGHPSPERGENDERDERGSGDGSFDASELRSRGIRTPCGVSVRVLRHQRPLGLAESLNEGLREAKSN
ncbi:MAG: glycosyltransferase family A protein, partial [Planctomycetota bacterium]